MQRNWVSFKAYIHYVNIEYEYFMLDIYKSLTEHSLKFFFTRLNEETPTLNIKVLVDNHNTVELVERLISQKIKSQKFKCIDSDFYYNNYRPDLNTSQWLPHGVVVKNKYIYEDDRYGYLNQKYIEEFFCSSTRIICEFLLKSPSIVDKVFFSIKINKLLLTNLLQMHQLDIHNFCLAAIETWKKYIIENYTNINLENDLTTIKEVDIEDYILLKEKISIDINEEVNYISNYKKSLFDLNNIDLNCSNYKEYPKFSDGLREVRKSYPSIGLVLSLIHMNNNRLDIKPISEILFYKLLSLTEEENAIGTIN